MKPLILGLCLLCSSTKVWAQPQAPDPFAAFYGAPIASRLQKVPLSQLGQSGQMALLSLRRPLDGAKSALVVAWGREAVLLSVEGALQVKALKEIEAMYSGEALVPAASASALFVENAAQVIPNTALGAGAEVLATYTLRNRGQVPLDVAVASTSCGCTAATLDKTRLNVGETTTLRATMHAEDERMVSVTLKTNDAARPTSIVALQSKRTFVPFAVPSPVSLFGEKGEVVTVRTPIALPAGWRIGRVSSTPAWLQSELKTDADAKGLQLQVTAPASAPEGSVQGKVTLELLGAPLKELTVSVGGFLSNDITVTPRLISLGNVGRGIARRTVIVRGPKPFSIRGVRSQTPGFKANVDPTVVARAHAVEMLIPLSGAVGDAIFQRATLDLSDGRELAIDIFGTLAAGRLPALAAGVVPGHSAPNFQGLDSGNKTVSLDGYRGQKNVLLTFFPRCFTGGCESHLASLRDVAPSLKQTQIIAVSGDDAAQVRDFAAQLHLPFPVLSDPTRKIALAFGAVQSPTDVPSRLTVLIDKNGVVRFVDTDVHVQTHGADVLNTLRALKLEP